MFLATNLLHTTPFLLLLLLPTSSALDPGFHLLNLTHIPISSATTTPNNAVHNGSISFTLAKGDVYSAHYCAHTFVAPMDKQVAGGPFACSDGWPDLLFYWREDGGDDGADTSEDEREGSGDSRVALDIWFGYLDCRPNGGAVSESGSLTLPPPTTTGTVADGSRVWDVVHVPIQTASSTAWFPGQYEEVCPRQ
ncbi:hypothetical protein SLS58_001915 [Diplodia intermedia]|uniref:Uncharacterized protein n=1 Tax=Diplodia intermedia TaxID=856260 RepID=A0ABR3U100_9PEZI